MIESLAPSFAQVSEDLSMNTLVRRFVVGPISLAAMALLVLAGLVELVRNFGYLWQLWRWPFLFSPAFYVYVLASLNAVYVPVMGCSVVTRGIGTMKISPSKGLASVAGVVLLTVFANYACQAVAWGSLPMARQPSGELYMRMIPFLPWPNYPFHW